MLRFYALLPLQHQTCQFTITHLKLNNTMIFDQPIHRNNLAFLVRSKTKKKQVFEKIIIVVSQKYSRSWGIVHCSKATDVVDLAYQLSACNDPVPVSMYFLL